MKAKHLIIGTASYIVASFLVQAVSHFAINASHYASIEFMRDPPLMFLGMLTMLIQGIVLTVLYSKWANGAFGVKQGLRFAWLAGLFFVTYLALVEPDKYNVDNIGAWIAVEGIAGFIQFTIFGFLVGKFIRIRTE